MSYSRDIRRGRLNQGLIGKVSRTLINSGTQALFLHRVAHFLMTLKVPFLPSIIRRINIFLTGADIHPGADIAEDVSLIHSVGTIIGEGTCIEPMCEIYGGVVLGGRGGNRVDDGKPIIHKNCVICAGAIIIGNINIGENVTVAAGSVVLCSIPDDVMVAGNPATVKVKYEKI